MIQNGFFLLIFIDKVHFCFRFLRSTQFLNSSLKQKFEFSPLIELIVGFLNFARIPVEESIK